MPLVPISTGVFAIIFSSEVLVLDLLCIISGLREGFFGSGLVGGIGLCIRHFRVGFLHNVCC